MKIPWGENLCLFDQPFLKILYFLRLLTKIYPKKQESTYLANIVRI